MVLVQFNKLNNKTMETFEGELNRYLNRLAEQDKECERHIKESQECTDYNCSNCCGAVICDDTDVCSSCKDHCSSACLICEIYDICENEHKAEL